MTELRDQAKKERKRAAAYAGEARKRHGCENAHCEGRSSPMRELGLYEAAAVRVAVTWPLAAARANPPADLCSGCAARTCEAYIGFGWSVSAERIDRRGFVKRRAVGARDSIEKASRAGELGRGRG